MEEKESIFFIGVPGRVYEALGIAEEEEGNLVGWEWFVGVGVEDATCGTTSVFPPVDGVFGCGVIPYICALCQEMDRLC